MITSLDDYCQSFAFTQEPDECSIADPFGHVVSADAADLDTWSARIPDGTRLGAVGCLRQISNSTSAFHPENVDVAFPAIRILPAAEEDRRRRSTSQDRLDR